MPNEDDETIIIVPELRIIGLVPTPSEADLIRPRIRARREGNTIIATAPTPDGGTKEVRRTCSAAIGSASVEFRPSHGDIFDYTYFVSNDASASGNAFCVRFKLDLGDHTTHGAMPPGWTVIWEKAGGFF